MLNGFLFLSVALEDSQHVSLRSISLLIAPVFPPPVECDAEFKEAARVVFALCESCSLVVWKCHFLK